MGRPRLLLASTLIVLLAFSTRSARAQVWTNYPSYNDLASQFLIPQNQVRASVGEPPLVWDPTLAQYAAWYASQREGDCALQHSGGPYGENIFWGAGTGWNPADAVNNWASEAPDYDYNSNSCVDGRMCGHYTQIVWSSTTRVGCAKVVCDGEVGVFMTCNYDPPGNYVGERPY
ncbi:pathogenesis-related protein PR-1-like [Nymphaea colorata]|uniref:SCP domain-containing protein n=1 Tax=Nymphaea colorata TaxID=210225 RepID=A0A5K0Y1B9_9MAGN|nr:pathogenesis-related protein PR-1-like [Nymphaea colorata]